MIRWERRGQAQARSGAAGWTNASRQIERALGDAGALDDAARTSIYFGTALGYRESVRPAGVERRVLYTMWESTWQLRDEVLPILRAAPPDALLVPSDWCRDTIRPWIDVPLATVPLGYDPETVRYERRRFRPGRERFRILYSGAANYRKFSILRELYAYFRSRAPLLATRRWELEWYLKLSGGDQDNAFFGAAEAVLGDAAEEVEPGLWRGRGRWKDGLPNDDWVVDNRFLPAERLGALYRTAHVVLNLHTGEGFSLLGLEAMASGTPLVVSDFSGTTQYANARNAWLVPVEPKRVRVPEPDGGEREKPLMLPRLEEAAARLLEILPDYYAATERAKRAYEDVRGLTWQNTALALCRAVADLGMLPAESAANAAA